MYYKVLEKNYDDVVLLSDVKNHLRVQHDLDDELILQIRNSAIDYAESYLNKCICDQKIEYKFFVDHYPCEVSLPVAGYTSVIQCSCTVEGKQKTLNVFNKEEIEIFSGSVKLKRAADETTIIYQVKGMGVMQDIKMGILTHIEMNFDKKDINFDALIKFYQPYKKVNI